MIKNIHFKVTGMHCSSCVTLITMELSDVSGVTGVTLDLKSGMGSAALTNESVDEMELLAAIKRAGYTGSIVGA